MLKSKVALGAALVLVTGACERNNQTSEQQAEQQPPAAEQPSPAEPTAAEGQPTAEQPREQTAKAPSQRDFEGRITVNVTEDQPATVEYIVKGDKVRLERTPGAGGGEDVDAIIDRSNDKVTVLLTDQKKYFETDLDQLKKQARQMTKEVELVKTDETRTVAGVTCQVWELTDQQRKVSACLVEGPPYLDVATLQDTTNLRLPGWAERVIEEGHFPLSVNVTDAAGKVVYRTEVAKWQKAKVDEDRLRVPEGFTKIDAENVREQVRGETPKE